MEKGLRVETRNLTKRFGEFTAVNKLNLVIEPGESFGFLGPNGAGKTTTLLMLLGIHKPTSGQVLINDQVVHSNAFELKRRIGVVAEYQTFYDDMSAWEYLMFFARLFDVKEPAKRGQALLEQVGLWEWRDVLVGGYSTGMKKKLGFVRAMLQSPDLLILDEPVSGLDPFGIVQIREMLNAEQAKGRTLLISSHILSEVERTVNRVGIITKGNLILQDSMANVRQNVAGLDRIELIFEFIDDNSIKKIKKLPFVQHLDQDGNHLSIVTKDDIDYRKELGRHVMENRLVLIEMRKAEKSLEEAFITITEKNLTNLAPEGKE